MGGWVAIRLERKPPTPSAKKRCEASSASGVESREPCFPIFASARARPPGLRVNCTAAASARNSRWRETASRMSRPKKAPIDPATRSESPAPTAMPPPLAVAPAAVAPEQDPPHQREHGEPAHHRHEPGAEPRVGVQDVGELVRHHALQLVPVEPVERAAGDRDHASAPG